MIQKIIDIKCTLPANFWTKDEKEKVLDKEYINGKYGIFAKRV